MWTRPCVDEDGTTMVKNQINMVSIDKDSAAKAAFRGRVAVDVFHHMKAFSSKLKELGLSNGSLLAGINYLHKIILRF
jgi:hypothetical protein